jgi:hypothetical protein
MGLFLYKKVFSSMRGTHEQVERDVTAIYMIIQATVKVDLYHISFLTRPQSQHVKSANIPFYSSQCRLLHQSEDGVDLAMIETFLNTFNNYSTSLYH